MVIDHIGGQRSWLYLISGGNHFFVSAAEGFVFISGATMGLVYAPIIARHGVVAMLGRVLRRARNLYLLTVGLTLLFALFSFLLNTPWSRDVTPASWYVFTLGVVTLHRSFSLTDVLLLYTLLVLAAGAVLALLAYGRTRIVVLVSVALWAVYQLEPDEVSLPWAITDGGFPFSAWQILFVVGLVIGYHGDKLSHLVAGRPHNVVFVVSTIVAILLIAVYAAELRSTLQLSPRREWILSTFFDKNDLRIGRLLALAGIGAFAYTFSTLFWVPLKALLGRLLLPVGQHALSAYTVHLFVVAVGASWIADPLRSHEEHAIVQLIGLAIVWAAVAIVLPRLGPLQSALATRATAALRPLVSWLLPPQPDTAE